MTRKINNNSNIKYKSEINLINKKIKPYSQNIELNIFDECSNLSFGYAITDYNDGDQVKPNKTFSIEYQLEFLGGSNSPNNIF